MSCFCDRCGRRASLALRDERFGFCLGVEAPVLGMLDAGDLCRGGGPVGVDPWDAANLNSVEFLLAGLVLG